MENLEKYENIIIKDKKSFKEKVSKIKQDTFEKLHILADFDRTLTKAFINGEKRPSLISVLRHKNILGEQYSKKAFELYDYYAPIESDPNISLEEKKKEMTTWWENHLELLVKTGLKKSDIKSVVESGILQFRDNITEFLELLKQKNIPLVIISANGLGNESISLFLEKNGLNFENIDIISNSLIFESDKAIGYKKPVIHTFNKDETILKDFPEIFAKVKDRKNIILLGDSLGDPFMATGFDYKNILKIGFLNENGENSLEKYSEL